MNPDFTNNNPNLLHFLFCFFFTDEYIDKYLPITVIVYFIRTSAIFSIYFFSRLKKEHAKKLLSFKHEIF